MIPTGFGAHEVAMPAVDGRSELAVAQARIDQHVVAATVGDDQVEDAVAVQVRQRDGAGREQARGLIAQHGGPACPVIDDHAVEALVGVDDILGAIPREVGHGQLDGLVSLVVGLERAIAVAQQHQDIAIGIADQAGRVCRLPVRSARVSPVGLGADRVGDRRQEATLAVAEIDAHATRGENGQVVDSVAVEVGHADDLGGARGLDGDWIGEAASSKAGEHAERVRAGVDRHEVGGTAGRERSGGHARRRPPGFVTAGVLPGSIARQPGSGTIGDGGCEGPIAQVAEDAHLTAELVGDHEIEPAGPCRIDGLDIGDTDARQAASPAGGRAARRRLASSRSRCCRKPTASRRRRCGPQGRSKPSPFRSAAMICAGRKPVASEPTLRSHRRGRRRARSRYREHRHWRGPGLDPCSEPRRCRVTGLPGLTVTGGSKVPGCPGMPCR